MTNFRRVASQLCAALPYYCLRFSSGSVGGFHTILITELYKENAEIKMTLDQLTWFASFGIMSIISAIINGFLTQRLGSRKLGIITALLMITSWLLYFYSTNPTILFVSRILIALRASSTICGPYISEISEPELRGRFLTINSLANVFGTFFSLLLGSLMYWRTIALVNLVFPLLAATSLVLLTPNSPTWLINEGRLDEAEEALCRLRGWAKPADVHTEFCALVESLQQSKTTGNEKKIDIEAATGEQPLRKYFQLFLERSFYLPLGTMCIIYILQSFSGAELISTYTGVIYQKLNSPINVSLATAITGGASVTGTLTALLFTKYLGKRKLVFFSLTLAVICHSSSAIIGFLRLRDEYLWVPSIATILAVFANSLGVGTSVQVIVSEVFPSSLRYIGSSMGGTIETIVNSIVKKLFLYIVASITMPGVFIMFTFINFIAFITYYFIFPETEGRSLKEIEDHYKGTIHLKENRK